MSTPGSLRRLKPSLFLDYGVAVLAVAVAMAVAQFLELQFQFEPLVPFFCAIIFSAWSAGFKPGLVAAALSLLAFHCFFLLPVNASNLQMEIPRLLVAAGASVLLVYLSAAQRRSTKALRESERRYRALFESLAESVVYLQILFENGEPRDAIYLDANPAWKKIWGLADLAGTTKANAIPAFRDISAELFERVGRVAATGRSDRFETYSAHLRKWLSVSAYSPRKEFAIVVLEDVTARKTAQDHLGFYIDAIPAIAWSVRPDGFVDFLNKRWVDYSGLTVEQYHQDPTGTVHPEDAPGVFKKWRAALAAGKPHENEMRFRRADGVYRWFLVRIEPIRDAQGAIVKWLGISIDIEERKAAQEALAQSERDLADAQRVARIGSWNHDIASGTIRWSDELYRIFEVDKTAAGVSFEMFVSRIHPDDRAGVLQANAEAKSSGEPFDLEYRINVRGGRVKHIRKMGYATKDAHGAVSGLFGTAQDITGRKLADEALREHAGRLQQLTRRLMETAEQERRSLAREMHDRIGPNLSALILNLRSVRDELCPSELCPSGAAAICARFADSDTLLAETVQQVRDIMGDLRPPALDDVGLFAALDQYLRQTLQRAGLAYEVSGSDPVPRLAPLVEIALFRIVQEALNNAIKHARATRIELALLPANGNARLTIVDNGVGFDTGARRTGMPGLGMTTMRERAEAIGARFSVASSRGNGTRVTIDVPYGEP